ncbi:spore coat protein [Paenibacillus mucilaginosus]|uniref:YraD n=2 Tax=Paenibacillus mucilaginosus TaxID=61624 RepID=H6NTT6_9BACL|nr:spore coat protein [Paenibacillus mucilaginosus]AEI39411.1 YraD [Paenibacillus mucilaginosus KNP414]AFC27680.1 YraD [Paenibacillus mucilaginosus 3016]MCG7214751.1 spore coat protein [Paenibacillus mucilaginosus]WDM28391.1 spore coat protein [Paenibacillus mucilaginosus]WFA16563.1 spore coat protein [Paenibacillus mucilaginosus]
MNTILERMTGLHTMTDQVIAMDLLIAAKSGVRNYAMAVTETATPEIKSILTQHLNEAILLHEQISAYMVERGFYHPHDVNEQVKLDLTNIQTALKLT